MSYTISGDNFDEEVMFGSLEEYFAYDPDEYYESLQMGLPVLYFVETMKFE